MSLEQRFWDKVDKRGEDECWNWTKACARNGYGIIWGTADTGNIYTHRYSYELHKGPIPEGLIVRHKCINNRKCVNPKHLEAGTAKDNTEDAMEQDRLAHSEKHGRAILKDNDIPVIKDMLDSGMTMKSIGIRFGVALTTISAIKRGETWKRVI